MTVIERRQGEPLDEAARRVATDALYASRDHGGTMHDAGAAAGAAVSSLYAGAVEALRHIAESAKHPSPTVNTSDYLGHAAEQALKRLSPARSLASRLNLPRCQHCACLADERSFMCEDHAGEADEEVQTLRDQLEETVRQTERLRALLLRCYPIVAPDPLSGAIERELGLPPFTTTRLVQADPQQEPEA